MYTLVINIMAILVMVYNTYFAIRVYRSSRLEDTDDVAVARLDKVRKVYVVLICCFLAGYIAITIASGLSGSIESVLMALIMFFGAIFVTISLYTLMTTFNSVKQSLGYRISEMQISLDSYIKVIPGGVYHCLTDPEMRVTFVNDGFTNITGYTVEDIEKLFFGRYIGMVLEEDRKQLITAINYVLKSTSSATISYRARKKNGDVVWISDSMSAVKDGRGKSHIFAVVSDITAEKIDAQTDGLTSLLNRKAFDIQLQEYMRANPEDKVGLYMIDLNHFKEVNDTYGHQSGDAVLKETASYISSVFDGHKVLVSRIGGDEFMVALKHTVDSEEAESLYKQLVDRFHIVVPDIPDDVKVTASVGFINASCNDDYEKLCNKVDIEMYKVKEVMHAARQ